MSFIYPNGVATVTVPVGQKIAIGCSGTSEVVVEYSTAPLSPPHFYENQRFTNSQVLLGTFAADRVVRISAGLTDKVEYVVGTAPELTQSVNYLNLAKDNPDVLMITGAGAPVDYTDGTPPATGETIAEIGSLYSDVTNGNLYINNGTKAEPLWKRAILQTSPVIIGTDLLIYHGAGVPVDYTDGTPPATGEGVAGIGSLYIDKTAGKLYINGGTKAQPLWKIVTSAS